MTAIEGMGLQVTAELLHSVATGVLFLLVAGWLVYALCRMERAALWSAHVHRWTSLGPITTAWTGWSIEGDQGTGTVQTTVFGTTTRVVRTDGRRYTFDGVPPADVVGQLICSSRTD